VTRIDFDEAEPAAGRSVPAQFDARYEAIRVMASVLGVIVAVHGPSARGQKRRGLRSVQRWILHR